MFHYATYSLAFALSVSVALVSACEGPCIEGITKAIIGNYSIQVMLAMSKIEGSITSQILKRPVSTPAISYLAPIFDEFKNRSYDHMENTVFKTYFHGRCQDPITGINPVGCPNPDCPVVCGTPGSICHFYSTFRHLAFNSTVHLMNEIIQPSSSAYQQAKKAILADAPASPKKRQLLRFTRKSFSPDFSSKNLMVPSMERREDMLSAELRHLLHQFHELLAVGCGGTPSGKLNGLPNCSWEDAFKSYILSFP